MFVCRVFILDGPPERLKSVTIRRTCAGAIRPLEQNKANAPWGTVGLSSVAHEYAARHCGGSLHRVYCIELCRTPLSTGVHFLKTGPERSAKLECK